VPYEQRYCDAKFESGNFLLRNVIVIVIIIVIIDHIYMSSRVVRLQLLTQEALMIKPGSEYVSRSRVSERENGRAESERENGRFYILQLFMTIFNNRITILTSWLN